MTTFSGVITTYIEGTSNEVFVEIEKIFNKKEFALVSISQNKKLEKNRSTSYTYNIKVEKNIYNWNLTKFINAFSEFVFSEVSQK